MGWFKSQMWKVLEWKDDSKDTIVYRFDMQGKEIMSGSQLTVRESQVAVFVHQGKIADVFGPGQHKLNTKNLPILSGIGSIWYQGESRFKAELYFVNTKQFVDCKWGTNNPVAMRDKEFGMIRIRAFGNYAFRITDAAAFLREIFGTNGRYKVQDIEGNVKNLLVSQMSDTIAESGISALDMAMNYQEFGNMIRDNAQVKLSEMGLTLTDFNVINISFPETVEKAIDERSSLGILADQMDTYTQKKAADALSDAAKNTGSAGAFMGMGVGLGAGGMVGSAFGGTGNKKSVAQKGSKFCPECGAGVSASAKFCPECGNRIAAAGVCPSCGTAVSVGAKFCPECGQKIG
ncbi:MAG: SPFH domain-containing protein [Corallococcus sp.]|nr:SPFH domain-containing protein [Corallococcus sp.]MCM1358956.1 SPFH domain-containing protein [Corallococcus sp.]MCM1394945.1 SPFH domain-containing protein [Corallococcus sp.]